MINDKSHIFNGKTIVLLFALLFLISIPGIILSQAKEMSPEEAIQWGIENNIDLNILRNSISELERSLEILDAAESFQVDLSATPIWHFGKNGEDSLEMSENSFTPSAEVSLTATKIIADDINLSTELAWESESLNQVDLDEIVNDMNANIKLSKQIYPDTWTENEKQMYRTKNSLQMKLVELQWEEIEKQIEFIQDYLNIIRIQEQVILAREQVMLAEENLTRVKKQIALGEGGYQQETEAVIALEEAENKRFSLEHNFSQAQKQWYLNLNLPEDSVIYFDDNSDFIQGLVSRMDSLEIKPENQPDLIVEALGRSYRIKKSQLEKEELQKELEWTEEEGKPKVNLSSGYQFPGDWFAMVDFSVKLADGGAQELREEQKEANIQQKEGSIAYLVEQVKLEAEQLIDQDQYNRLHLNTQLLVLEKEQNRVDIIEKQYQQGMITDTQRKNAVLALKEKEINVKQAKDEWFINRLKIAHFIGYLQREI